MPTTYEISPPPELVTFALTNVATLSPPESFWAWMKGIPQQMQISPSPVFWPIWRGDRTPQGIQVMVHGIPGTTTMDDEFPDYYRAELRVSVYVPPAPKEYFVQMYHGSPGVKQGDDNWDQTDPSYQPQLRTNTLPHTTDPTIQNGRWRYNEAFLAP